MAMKYKVFLNNEHIDEENENICYYNEAVAEENKRQEARLAAVEARQDNVEATVGFVAAAVTVYAIAKKGPKLVSKVASLVGRKKKTDEFVDDVSYSSTERKTANAGFEDEYDENGDYREC